MISPTLPEIKKLLEKEGHEAHFQGSTQQVYTILKHDNREFPLFVRIMEHTELMQMLAFFPVSLQKESVADTARLLLLFNKELDIPGFGMDEEGGVVFFRCMINLPGKKIDPALFHQYLNTISTACKAFSPAVEAIVSRALSFDKLYAHSKEQLAKIKGSNASDLL